VNNHQIADYDVVLDSKYGKVGTFSKIGHEMDAFGKASHLVGWAGLRPRNDELAGKIQSRKTLHGNKYLRQMLVETAWVASFEYCAPLHRQNSQKGMAVVA
jgi:transposase